jgi:arginase
MILTPYFLDEALPGLHDLAGEAWIRNEALLEAGDKQGRMMVLYRPLALAVKSAVEAGDRPVSVAGDCCTAIGVLAGLQHGGLEPSLIWFDAHGDFNTWETSPSGFLGGMPLAMIVGRGEQRLSEGVGQRPLPESRVILTDARDLDPLERAALQDSDVTHLPDVTMLLERPLPAGPIYVHFDVDVINAGEAPAMNYLAAGGPSAAELRGVFAHLAASAQVAAVSVSSWNPALDEDGQTREVVLDLLQVLIS